MKIISQTDKNFDQIIKSTLKNRCGEIDNKAEGVVKKIISAVKQKGDSALFEFTYKFDRINLN